MSGLGLFPRMLREALLRARRRPATVGAGSVAGRRGEGYEFVELRAYQPGDDPRRIDWAATARSSGLQTRVMLEENPLQIAAIADASDSMRVGRERGLAAAAQDAIAAWFAIARPGDRTYRFGGGEIDVYRALAVARRTLRPGAALLVVSDFFWLDAEPGFRDIAIASARRFDVTALVARDPWFDELPLRGFVRLRDAEDGTSARLFIGRRERERYRTAVARRERTTIDALHEAGWRAAPLEERDGAASLYAAFGLCDDVVPSPLGES